MNFKKYLKSYHKAQSAVEYILTFIALATSIIIIFGAFNPENLGIRAAFNQAVTSAIQEINSQ